MKFIAIGILLLTILANSIGCATTPVIQVNNPFIEQDYVPFTKQGTGIINGQAFLKTKGGDVKYGAGGTVYLIPVTEYTNELMSKAIEKGGGFTTNMDYRLNNYIKKTIADGEGKFDFKNIPSGEYYVGCQIAWKYATQYGLRPTGGNIVKRVSLKEGESQKVILTK